ncbi:DUF4245 domain-containing protein [Corynebacterium felinum]|uniref:DUF4245 domain-containing protein n=1 Tax=Corynebacterium felinum TaxID=131318 RepID=A0ABU2B967_9CORY|nr:DUF4245 domain-containing protein [Corynebacterium felinum]MDF5822019.1 DUF4245 domain-containing protein [Corynebacterium felinum]MDR7355190.1 hypothetical protein [Corynebacterium felinum]WJY94541.1 hypothetical protein CFELI_04555 [Corynebacterium felinum]
MAEEKPRIFQSGRDIVLSLSAIIVVMAVTVGFTGMCSYGRGNPEFGPVQEVDASVFFGLEARAMSFPVRLPEAPEGWIANSARRTAVKGEPAPVVGWVVGKTGYVQMTQTSVSVKDVVENFDEHPRQLTDSYDVEGIKVELFHSDERDVRDLRIIDLGDVRVVYTGAATQAEFNDIIARTIKAQPLPSSL